MRLRADSPAKIARPLDGRVLRVVRADAVAAAVHVVVKLVGSHQVQTAGFELQVAAIRIVETAVIAVQEQVAAARVVRSSPIAPWTVFEDLVQVLFRPGAAAMSSEVETWYVKSQADLPIWWLPR